MELHGILLVAWPIELITYFSRESFDSLIISDLIKCFSNVLIFAIFVIRKNVRILFIQQYERLREVSEEVEQVL